MVGLLRLNYLLVLFQSEVSIFCWSRTKTEPLDPGPTGFGVWIAGRDGGSALKTNVIL